jgi:hypothetical protein
LGNHDDPVLDNQSVHITLAVHRVKIGHAVTIDGTAEPHIHVLVVTLEFLHAGKWYPRGTAHESAKGTFVFSVGRTESYRAVLNQRSGYHEFGYSNAVTLVGVRLRPAGCRGPGGQPARSELRIFSAIVGARPSPSTR